ncbi:ABC transporter substrate-binding protein [Chitinibacteraceae bacterium HSL-7]
MQVKMLLPCLIAAFAGTAFAAPAAKPATAQAAPVAAAPTEIVIGQSIPVTGKDADTGRAMALGAAMYFGRVNARGGINGAYIDHHVLDDASQADRAMANTRKFVSNDNAVVLINYFGSGTAEQLAKAGTLRDAGISLIGVHGGAESTRNATANNIYQLRAGYAAELERTIALLAGNLGVERFGALVQDDADGRAALAALKEVLQKRNLALGTEALIDAGTRDVSKATQLLAKANPQAVLLLTSTQPAAAFTKSFKQAGGTAQLYAISNVQFEDAIRQIGAQTAHGIGISQVFPYPSNVRAKIVRDFQDDAAIALKAGEFPSYAMFEGYLAARVAVAAIRAAGPRPSAETVSAALAKMGRLDLGGYIVNLAPGTTTGSKFTELTMISPTGALTR